MEDKKKQLRVEICDTSRAVCKFVNENGINLEDILALKGTQGNYILFYFK